MGFLWFFIALCLFWHFKGRMRHHHRGRHLEDRSRHDWSGAARWHDEWHRHWAEKFSRHAEQRLCDFDPSTSRSRRRAERDRRREERRARRHGSGAPPPDPGHASGTAPVNGATTAGGARPAGGAEGTAVPEQRSREDAALARARRRAAAEASFYLHLTIYFGVIAMLTFINLATGHHTAAGGLRLWVVWPAFGWGIGIAAHYMAVFGSRFVKERVFDPVVERELRREKASMQTEKQASIDELSSTIAHEIRNPVAAAKSLVQQMGEDPTSVENVEYAKVALEELDRVERRISHLLKYAKEEDYQFANVNLAGVVDSALTQLRAKLDGARVAVARNYIGGPTVQADGEKLRQVFANIIDNAIDALEPVAEGRRIELFIENGTPGRATVRVRDNGRGIPADRIDRIFNPFFTTKEKGTGLGMAISKKIVEAHEGTIDVVSQEGRGAEFVVTLPLPR
jgi:signal transduction histidine kinase